MEVSVHMRNDEDLLVRGAWQGAPNAGCGKVTYHVGLHAQPDRHGLASTEHVAQPHSIRVADVEARPIAGALPNREIVRDAVHDAHRAGTVFEGARHRAFGAERVPERARPWNVVNQHRSTSDVPSQVVGVAAHADPDELELQATGRGRCRALRRTSGLQSERPASRGERHLPAARIPLRPQVERLPVHFFQPTLSEVPLHPVLGGLVTGGTDVTTPKKIAGVAVGQGNRVHLQQHALEALPPYVAVTGVLGP